MESKFENKIAFYAENENGLYDEIILDLFEKEYEYNSDIDKRDLSWRADNRLQEFLISQQAINAVYDRVDKYYNCGSYDFEEDYKQCQSEKEMRLYERAGRPELAKEKIWDAISWKLDERELKKISSVKFAYENYDYYDLGLIIDRVHAFMSGERPVRYFTAWCNIMTDCMYISSHICKNKRISAIYDEIADKFDDLTFMSSSDSETKRQAQCREFIAYLKYCNHQIEDIKNHRTTDYEKNGIVVYVSNAFYIDGSDDIMQSVCVADKRRHLVNYYFAHNLILKDNYSIMVVAFDEFEMLNYEYENYKLDTSLTIDSQLGKKG